MGTRFYQIAFIFKSNLVKGPASTTPIFIWSLIYNQGYSTLRWWSRAASKCQTWTDFVKRGNKLKKAKRKEIYRCLHDRKNLFAIATGMQVSGLFTPFPFAAKNVIDSQLKILYNILIGNRFRNKTQKETSVNFVDSSLWLAWIPTDFSGACTNRWFFVIVE